ncbi:MAG: hypothetical protein E5W60_06395 [Mesorhizobium sp.]|nr:MAG: hypothetical protein E5W60_06395 [Mesorhizobium sp.]TJW67295.1 MAG: hypothetical protein E5V29_19020 [Mesorhizobium sp.]
MASLGSKLTLPYFPAAPQPAACRNSTRQAQKVGMDPIWAKYRQHCAILPHLNDPDFVTCWAANIVTR